MSTDLAVRAADSMVPWDPFQLMDRLDEDALRKELEGIASTELVYIVKEGGQEVVGLSKTGVDECCMVLVAQGQVIREEELDYTVLGDGEDREALFKVKAARFAVAPDGREVRLDQVLGVKRQPLYYEQMALSLDTKVPGKKYKGLTYRQLLERDDGRDYLGWMAENFSDEAIRRFAGACLNGEDVEIQPGRKLNPHWYEAGAMKAARNARFRLIPGHVRAQIIARARQAGQAKVVDAGAHRNGEDQVERLRREEAQRRQSGKPVTEPTTKNPERAEEGPTEKQLALFTKLLQSSVFTEEERTTALEWMATQATRQSMKAQIDWALKQVDVRKPKGAAADARD